VNEIVGHGLQAGAVGVVRAEVTRPILLHHDRRAARGVDAGVDVDPLFRLRAAIKATGDCALVTERALRRARDRVAERSVDCDVVGPDARSSREICVPMGRRANGNACGITAVATLCIETKCCGARLTEVDCNRRRLERARGPSLENSP
jgi:hypothetical protein